MTRAVSVRTLAIANQSHTRKEFAVRSRFRFGHYSSKRRYAAVTQRLLRSRVESRETRGAAKAPTAADGFLIATRNEWVWRLNGDHVQRWIVDAQQQQQRLREDMNAERRFPKPMRAGIMEKMYRFDLRKNRLDSWMHEASVQLVNWTQRQRLRELIWDDTYPSMMPSFPWHTFAQRLEDKCEAAGITLSRSSEGALLESRETLEKEEKN
jgi:hypothetical protein